MRLSVIIPVYNEVKTVLEIIRRVQEVPVVREIVIVDDGSTDGTGALLKKIYHEREFQSKNSIKIIFKEKNEGKGASIISGLKYVTGDYVIFQDADLELNPAEIITLTNELNSDCNVVYGSRFLKRQSVPFITLMANRSLTFLTNLLFKGDITDMETCYKLCERELLLSLKLKSTGFEIEPEITCKILKKNIKIREVPISYKPRRRGKKIDWSDGFKALYYLFKYRLKE